VKDAHDRAPMKDRLWRLQALELRLTGRIETAGRRRPAPRPVPSEVKVRRGMNNREHRLWQLEQRLSDALEPKVTVIVTGNIGGHADGDVLTVPASRARVWERFGVCCRPGSQRHAELVPTRSGSAKRVTGGHVETRILHGGVKAHNPGAPPRNGSGERRG